MASLTDLRAMLRKFGVVTVMDVKAYKAERFTSDGEGHSKGEWDNVSTFDANPLFELDTLKIANINSEGPTKTITGGQNADTLLKYGKTFTIEMQDALGRYDVLESIFGVNFSGNHQYASVTDRFPAELTIVGSTFVIDQKTGAKQPIKIVLPLFLGDGILNLTQDAEGDASVFDLNGSLLKFNGIDGSATSSDVENCGEDRFIDTHAAYDGYIYKAGKDNEFYFLCTNEGYEELLTTDYSEAYNAA